MVVGPGLLTQDEEVAELGAVLGDRLRIADGNPLDAIAAARGATLHLSCHGHHDADNPMLSTYELADGTCPPLRSRHSTRRRPLSSPPPAGRRPPNLPACLDARAAHCLVCRRSEHRGRVAYTIPDDMRTVAAVARIHAELANGASRRRRCGARGRTATSWRDH